VDARLFVIPASHPSIAAALMLERKGIDFKRTDLLPVISKGVLRAAGFPGVTVPALKIGGEEPNAADFQIAPSVGLMLTLDDLRPAIENRPAAALAKRIVPNYPGRTPPILPPAWLDPLGRVVG
jgi:glutathione S-transferase